jgi:hypothetical protein
MNAVTLFRGDAAKLTSIRRLKMQPKETGCTWATYCTEMLVAAPESRLQSWGRRPTRPFALKRCARRDAASPRAARHGAAIALRVHSRDPAQIPQFPRSASRAAIQRDWCPLRTVLWLPGIVAACLCHIRTARSAPSAPASRERHWWYRPHRSAVQLATIYFFGVDSTSIASACV